MLVLEMVFCLMMFIALIYTTMTLIVQCMFILALKDMLLIRISLCYSTRDYDISL
jgi:hypothetical protein